MTIKELFSLMGTTPQQEGYSPQFANSMDADSVYSIDDILEMSDYDDEVMDEYCD